MGKLSKVLLSKQFITHIKRKEEIEAINLYQENTNSIDINFIDNITEESCIMLSIENKLRHLTSLLMRDPRLQKDYQNSDGETAISYSASQGDLLTMYYLIKIGAKTNVVNNDNSTILHLSVTSQNAEVLELCHKLNLPIDWNGRDKLGRTAFWVATGNSETRCLQYLASLPQIDVNLPDYLGRTPAHYLKELPEDDEKFNILHKLGSRFHWDGW